MIFSQCLSWLENTPDDTNDTSGHNFVKKLLTWIYWQKILIANLYQLGHEKVFIDT